MNYGIFEVLNLYFDSSYNFNNQFIQAHILIKHIILFQEKHNEDKYLLSPFIAFLISCFVILVCNHFYF